MPLNRWVRLAACCSLALLSGLFACQSSSMTNTSCDPASDPARCGTAMPLSCSAPMLDCRNGAVDGCETNVGLDLENCGQCGTRCPDVTNGAAACAEGACAVGSCQAPYLNCNRVLADGCEANSSRDPEHCGDCDTRCPSAPNAGPACSAGKCKAVCNAPFLDCNSDATDGCEINTATDINNCGSCGNKCPTGAGGVPACANGACILTKCAPPLLTCGAGPADTCETNTGSDVNNCAACGNKCPQVANGTPACKSGACGIGTCSATFRDCNNTPADGCETDTGVDPLHCGTCGNRCDLAHAAPDCQAGGCTIGSCEGAYKDCNTTPADGCEINSASDPNNCGACDNKCPGVANGTPGCAAGLCGVGSCNAPFQNCNGSAADGCETNTAGDVNNCGACGNKCPLRPNTVATSCMAGACKFTCQAGFADCDGNPVNGCEVNLSADPSNCGVCGNQCQLKPNTTGFVCQTGTCKYTCSSGFGDCNANPGDGCETNVASDINNCGVCGSRCTIPQGSGTCSGSACRVASCTNPFRDCNNVAFDGCESNVQADPRNCLTCGNVCPTRPNTSSTVCSAAGCGFNCAGGRANCNGNVVDGCETNTVDDSSNCGRCGNKCGFFDWCSGSKCCTFGVFC